MLCVTLPQPTLLPDQYNIKIQQYKEEMSKVLSKKDIGVKSDGNESNNNTNQTFNSCPRSRNINKTVKSEFVRDITIPDRSTCPVNTTMTKTWRLRNSGDVEWGNDTELVFFKGNECLVVEKRHSVPNAQPGEEVDVSAVIKTPMKTGLYCTYFKLKKNGSFFGSNLWVELFAVANDQTSPISSTIKNHNCKCICGETLITVSPRQAYGGINVYCDVCNAECSSDETVYHCPLNRNTSHPDGYDMCSNCVNAKSCSFASQSNNVNANKNLNENKVYIDIQVDVPNVQQNDNNNNNNDNNNNNNEPIQNQNNNEDKKENVVPIVPVNPIVVNESGNNNNQNVDVNPKKILNPKLQTIKT